MKLGDGRERGSWLCAGRGWTGLRGGHGGRGSGEEARCGSYMNDLTISDFRRVVFSTQSSQHTEKVPSWRIPSCTFPKMLPLAGSTESDTGPNTRYSPAATARLKITRINLLSLHEAGPDQPRHKILHIRSSMSVNPSSLLSFPHTHLRLPIRLSDPALSGARHVGSSLISVLRLSSGTPERNPVSIQSRLSIISIATQMSPSPRPSDRASHVFSAPTLETPSPAFSQSWHTCLRRSRCVNAMFRHRRHARSSRSTAHSTDRGGVVRNQPLRRYCVDDGRNESGHLHIARGTACAW